MQVGDVRDLIRHGESQHVEFKTGFNNDEDVARLLVAFANSGGGTILVGVRDDGELAGLPDAGLRIAGARVRNVAASLLPTPVRMERVEVDGATILGIHVEPAPESALPLATARGEVLLRRGSSTVRASKQHHRPPPTAGRELVLFVAMSFRFEEEPALVDYFEAIKRAVSATRLPIRVDRVDLAEGDYEVSTEIVERIGKADIVLCDFTLNSLNVYYEAGVARGAGKYTMRTARKGTVLPFDLATWRTAVYANATQLEAQLGDALVAAYAQLTEAD